MYLPTKTRASLWPALWKLFIAAILLLPTIVWGSNLGWQLGRVTLFAFFPLLGLLTFSLIWLQFLVLGLGIAVPSSQDITQGFLSGSGIYVFLLIIFHPLLLAVAMFQSGNGLPLQSLYSYEPPAWQVFITYAIIAWSIFVLTELSFHLQKIAWVKKASTIIEYINYVAFFLVFWHSIHLGTNLQAGSLRPVWWFYAVSAGLVICTITWKKIRTHYQGKEELYIPPIS